MELVEATETKVSIVNERAIGAKTKLNQIEVQALEAEQEF